jgi:hypothetical protein
MSNDARRTRARCAALIRLPSDTTITKGQGLPPSHTHTTPKLSAASCRTSVYDFRTDGSGSTPDHPRALDGQIDTGGGLKRRRQDV